MVDTNRNGYIEEKELQQALSWNYQRFSPSTLRLLIFLFRDPRESSSIIGCFFLFHFGKFSFCFAGILFSNSIAELCKLFEFGFLCEKLGDCFFIMYWLLVNLAGPKEFAAIWSCLGQWRVSTSIIINLLKSDFVGYSLLWNDWFAINENVVLIDTVCVRMIQ